MAQQAGTERSLLKTIVNDLKLVVSTESLPVLSSAAALRCSPCHLTKR